MRLAVLRHAQGAPPGFGVGLALRRRPAAAPDRSRDSRTAAARRIALGGSLSDAGCQGVRRGIVLRGNRSIAPCFAALRKSKTPPFPQQVRAASMPSRRAHSIAQIRCSLFNPNGSAFQAQQLQRRALLPQPAERLPLAARMDHSRQHQRHRDPRVPLASCQGPAAPPGSRAAPVPATGAGARLQARRHRIGSREIWLTASIPGQQKHGGTPAAEIEQRYLPHPVSDPFVANQAAGGIAGAIGHAAGLGPANEHGGILPGRRGPVKAETYCDDYGTTSAFPEIASLRCNDLCSARPPESPNSGQMERRNGELGYRSLLKARDIEAVRKSKCQFP